MPTKYKKLKQYFTRCAQRKLVHGNWRQIYLDCGGMCQWRDEETGEICGSVKSLEFHEPFGEDHNGDGRMQQRILLCWYHHYIYHMGDITRGQPKKSKLTEDISYEIDKENDLAGWMKKYGLVKKNENGTMQNEIESQSASGPAI